MHRKCLEHVCKYYWIKLSSLCDGTCDFSLPCIVFSTVRVHVNICVFVLWKEVALVFFLHTSPLFIFRRNPMFISAGLGKLCTVAQFAQTILSGKRDERKFLAEGAASDLAAHREAELPPPPSPPPGQWVTQSPLWPQDFYGRTSVQAGGTLQGKGDRRHALGGPGSGGPAGRKKPGISRWFPHRRGPVTAGERLERGSLRQGAPGGRGSKNASRMGGVSTGRGGPRGDQVQSQCGAAGCGCGAGSSAPGQRLMPVTGSTAILISCAGFTFLPLPAPSRPHTLLFLIQQFFPLSHWQ